MVGRPVAGRTYDFAPVIGVFLKEHLFGDIFERDILNRQERELATVGALAGIGNVNAQLTSHMRVSMNTGISAEQLQETVRLLDKKAGLQQAAMHSGFWTVYYCKIKKEGTGYYEIY